MTGVEWNIYCDWGGMEHILWLGWNGTYTMTGVECNRDGESSCPTRSHQCPGQLQCLLPQSQPQTAAGQRVPHVPPHHHIGGREGGQHQPVQPLRSLVVMTTIAQVSLVLEHHWVPAAFHSSHHEPLWERDH